MYRLPNDAVNHGRKYALSSPVSPQVPQPDTQLSDVLDISAMVSEFLRLTGPT